MKTLQEEIRLPCVFREQFDASASVPLQELDLSPVGDRYQCVVDRMESNRHSLDRLYYALRFQRLNGEMNSIMPRLMDIDYARTSPRRVVKDMSTVAAEHSKFETWEGRVKAMQLHCLLFSFLLGVQQVVEMMETVDRFTAEYERNMVFSNGKPGTLAPSLWPTWVECLVGLAVMERKWSGIFSLYEVGKRRH